LECLRCEMNPWVEHIGRWDQISQNYRHPTEANSIQPNKGLLRFSIFALFIG
jgi:hypothetical protein